MSLFALICYILIGPFKFIVGLPPVAASLCCRAFSRAKLGFRPNTQCNYDSMFKLFLGFCVFIKVSMQNLNVSTILLFMEFLVSNGASPDSVSNHVFAVKAMVGLYGLSVAFLINLKLNCLLSHCK